MPLQKLKDCLDREQVRYVTISHSPAYTAQEIAATAHVPGKELAKTVMIKLDDEMHMAVLPASSMVNFTRLKGLTGVSTAELATEQDFVNRFPGCEVGAMPPFGNLWDMKVFVAEELTQDEQIAFNAGSHTELVRLSFGDFVRVVEPRVCDFAASGTLV
ncbi:MAG: YbaK/EbsC family protein [bacterium]|nr:YbaK/EbsC family protein [bacterium]